MRRRGESCSDLPCPRCSRSALLIRKPQHKQIIPLKHFFGPDWIDRYLDSPGYLQIDETNQTTMDLKGLRIIDLAEVVYNLQHVPNFDSCISRMRDGDIEGTAAELDLGRMLYLNQVSFRYVVPQGVKGKDYDAEIIFPDRIVACADAKCALENTDLKAKAIFNKLEKARKQLPPDQPGIIFAKMPPHWMAAPAFVSTTVEQAHELFRQTERNCLHQVLRGTDHPRRGLRHATTRLQGTVESQDALPFAGLDFVSPL